MHINSNYQNISETYLFSEIAARVKRYQEENPDAKIIKMGIGDVTRPLCSAAVEALKKAADEMGTKEGFKGYGPEQGYDFLKSALASYYKKTSDVELELDEIFVSDGAKSDIGNILDIQSLAKICHQHHILLLVDNAHGAYLKFMNAPFMHPLDAGADLACDSAHKTLPALTGAAYLHISKQAPQMLLQLSARVRDDSVMFGSTSPSYLIMESMDKVNKWLITHPDAYKQFALKVNTLKQEIKALGFHLRESEPLKITISVPHQGASLMQALTALHLECEYADPDFVVMMLSPLNSDDDLWRIKRAFTLLSHDEKYLQNKEESFKTDLPEVKYQPYELLFALEEEVTVDDKCIGRICVRCHIGCPPAILPIVPGEVINVQTIAILKKYGISTIHVLKER